MFKKLGLCAIFLVAIPLKAQFSNATQLRSRNISTTAPADTQCLMWVASTRAWTPGACTAGAGSGTVTSATVAGTANKITVSGTCTITSSGTCTVDLPWLTATTGTFTLTNAKTFAVTNTLTLGGTDGSTVAFGAGGTVVYTGVTTLSSLASIGTITTGVWNGTSIAVANGGTGATARQAAFDNLAPVATVAGSLIYWDGTHWVKLDGNASGTNCLTENASGVPSWASCGSGGGAPTNAQYVTLATDGTLSAERVLTAGSGITLTDAGAGSTITVAFDSSVLAGSYFALGSSNAITGVNNTCTSSATEACFELVGTAIPSGINAGGLYMSTTGRFGWFDGTNAQHSISVAGSGINYPSAPSAGVLHVAGSTFSATSSAVVSADMNITTTSCTAPTMVTSISSGGVGTCTSPRLPIQSKSANYTTTTADAGTIIYHPTSDNNARTFTIDSNANAPLTDGCITFINDQNTVTIAITTDTLVLAGAGTTGSRTLAANGVATACKVTSTRWYINGTGLT